ncbi:MAG: hypothetical protein CMP57_01230 [Flavobacteriales bacterium]|nr:hypothetical protein [Flavobacteriales bacterium]|tara:strand:- start:7419 stop:7955 length:537 start_codon:yes stop_codon:yes gene_type:complete
MKNILIILFLTFSFSLCAQRYMTRSAEVYFLSEKEALEIVEATNKQVGAVIDLGTAEIAFQIQLRAFHFKIALMEEHFNENYVESDLYPTATFRGKFTDLPEKISSEIQLQVQGEMDFHGRKRKMTLPVKVSMKKNILHGTSQFSLLCSDFEIDIPKIVSDKLANEIKVTVKAELSII